MRKKYRLERKARRSLDTALEYATASVNANQEPRTAKPAVRATRSKSRPGANDAYSTHNIVGVVHVGDAQKAYGPDGAYIKTSDPRGRDIHGGGSALSDSDAFAPFQSRLMPTYGCTRGYNQDIIDLGEAITSFQTENPNVPIPYIRE